MASWVAWAALPEFAAYASPPPLQPMPPPLEPVGARSNAGQARAAFGTPSHPIATSTPAFGSAPTGYGQSAPVYPASPYTPSPSLALHAPSRVDAGTAILLSVITLGVYGLFPFFRCARQYQSLAPGSGRNFETYFWFYVVLGFLATFFMLVFFPLGILLSFGTIAVGYMTLTEFLEARSAAVSSRGLGVQLTSPDTLKMYWVFGQLSAYFLIGILLIVIQAEKLFEDHNRIVGALAASHRA